ncbi:MAG: leucine-rich repeat domain-containing protein, partial [Prevotella sp.]|nr:leucine-rich repeat domain-containing protein [Prevotella sp.]
SLSDINWSNNIRAYGADVFSGCTSLTKAELSSNLEEMGSNVFRGCTNITSVTIQEGCDVIGSEAFLNCAKLKSVSIPNSVTSVGASAFADCTALETANIGSGVKTIPNYMFENCTSLQTIRLGSKTESVNYRAFRGCPLRSITVPNAEVPKANDDAFNIFTGVLYVPAASVSAYQAHSVWGKFAQVLPLVEHLYLSIVQCEGGVVRIPVASGASFAVAVEAEQGWKVNTVTYNGEDVTEQLVDGVFTTPTIQESAELRVAYELIDNHVQQMSASHIRAYGNGGQIVVVGAEVGELVSVYSIDGILVGTGVADGRNLRFSVKTGDTYIVKAGTQTIKLAM